MLIKTSRRSVMSVLPVKEQLDIPVTCLQMLPTMSDVSVSLVIAWTGVMRVHLKSGLLQKNIIRYLSMLKALSGEKNIKTYLLTHKLLPLPDLNDDNKEDYVEECIIPQGYTHGLAYKRALIVPSEFRRLVILFSDGKCSDTNSIYQEIEKHQRDTFIVMITLNNQVQETWLRLTSLPNVCLMSGARIDNEIIYEDTRDIGTEILNWYVR